MTKNRLEDFTKFVNQAQIKIHPSIEPYEFGELGLGIRAVERAKVGTELIRVPPSALIGSASVPGQFCSMYDRKKLTAHALLAAYIAFGDDFSKDTGRYSAWKATWPSFDSLEASLPMLWSGTCRRELVGVQSFSGGKLIESSMLQHETHSEDRLPQIFPGHLACLVQKQEQKQREDFIKAVDAVPAIKAAYTKSTEKCREEFLYAWCIVNTRCLYYKPSRVKQDRANAKGDNMVVCPLIDLFNHQSSPCCTVQQEALDLVVKTSEGPSNNFESASSTPLKTASPQLFVTYGPHSNDTLLVEYGFLLPGHLNKHDSINLDHFVLDNQPDHILHQLDQYGYLGSYTLFSPQSQPNGTPEVCFRTQVSALLGILSHDDWEKYLEGAIDDSDIDPGARTNASVRIYGWVRRMLESASQSIDRLERMETDEQELSTVFLHDPQLFPSLEGTRTGLNDDEEPSESPSGSLPCPPSHGPVPSDPDHNLHALATARARHSLVLARWKQVHDICESYLATDRMPGVVQQGI